VFVASRLSGIRASVARSSLGHFDPAGDARRKTATFFERKVAGKRADVRINSSLNQSSLNQSKLLIERHPACN
jgi:hypothetical protein